MNGTPFKIGEREFIVPRLRVRAFESAILAVQAAQAIETEADPFGLERLNAVCGAIVDLLRENYPELTLADVKALNPCLDELDGILGGLLRAGGKKPAGEAVAP